MNVILLGTARGEYEIHVLDERIESGGYGPFNYTVIIPNKRRTRDDPQLPELHYTCDCQKPQLTGIPCSHVIVVCQHRIYSLLKAGLLEKMKLVVTNFQWIHYNQDGIVSGGGTD
jgi:SWIM zinc finger